MDFSDYNDYLWREILDIPIVRSLINEFIVPPSRFENRRTKCLDFGVGDGSDWYGFTISTFLC